MVTATAATKNPPHKKTPQRNADTRFSVYYIKSNTYRLWLTKPAKRIDIILLVDKMPIIDSAKDWWTESMCGCECECLCACMNVCACVCVWEICVTIFTQKEKQKVNGVPRKNTSQIFVCVNVYMCNVYLLFLGSVV